MIFDLIVIPIMALALAICYGIARAEGEES